MSYDQGGNGNWQNTDPNGNYYYNGAENNEFYDQDYASQQPEQQQGGEGYYDEYGQPNYNYMNDPQQGQMPQQQPGGYENDGYYDSYYNNQMNAGVGNGLGPDQTNFSDFSSYGPPPFQNNQANYTPSQLSYSNNGMGSNGMNMSGSSTPVYGNYDPNAIAMTLPNDPYPAWTADPQSPVSIEQIEDVFIDLTNKFGFQRDSMRNIFDLFMTLLDSRTSRMSPDQALLSVHADYIGGDTANYKKWYFAAQLDMDDEVGFRNMNLGKLSRKARKAKKKNKSNGRGQP